MNRRASKPMPRESYARDTTRVARSLLGCFLESRIDDQDTVGRIVEVEAYVGPHDPAAHGYRNRKSLRNEALFGPPGTSYVYFIYGMHWCFNAVTEAEGYPAAVLIRALEPLEGVPVMMVRRNTENPRRLCSGPARLCQALGITGAMNGRSLVRGPVRILEPPGRRRMKVVASPRIGISRARDWPLRLCLRASPWESHRAEAT